MSDRIDKLERRCPRLGGQVPFTYCKTCETDQSYCFKTIDCWWEYFDVVDYLKKQLSSEEFEKLLQTRPKPKISSLVELIEKAKQNAD